MPTPLRPSRACRELVMSFEGLRRTAGRTPGAGWTLGYGHSASAREGATVDAADAEALLTWDLNRAGAAVEGAAFAPLNQNQFDALTAFAFNVGEAAFRGSTALRRLNAGDYLGAAAALERWRAAPLEGETQVIDALVRRRAAEKALFLTPPEGFRPAPTPLLRPHADPSDADPLDPNQARPVAAVAEASLEGEVATVRRVEAAPPTLLTDATDALRARFATLFADPADLEPAPAAPEPPSPEPDASLDAAPFAAPEATDAVAGDLAPEPAEAHPFSAPNALVEAEPEAPPFPEPAAAAQPTALFPHADQPPFAAPPAPLPEFNPARAPEPRGFVEEARGLVPADRTRTYLLVGVAGAILFALSLVSMLDGRATALNLLLGLAGVLLMAPAGVYLFLPWRGRMMDDDRS